MNKILRTLRSFLWRSVVYGLGFMMIALLILNIFSLSWLAPETLPESIIWEEEVLTEVVKLKTYLPSYTFPLFPALYTPLVAVYPQFLMQCIGCICAAAGVIAATQIIRKESLSVWVRFLTAPLSVLLGFVPLLLQLRIYNSPKDLLWTPILFTTCTLLFAALEEYKRKIDVDRINAALDKSRDGHRAHLFALAPFDYLASSYTAMITIVTCILTAALAFVSWGFIVNLLGGSPIPLSAYRW